MIFNIFEKVDPSCIKILTNTANIIVIPIENNRFGINNDKNDVLYSGLIFSPVTFVYYQLANLG
ncbi:hypothetical protein [Candidatus Nanopusillus massiliensis]|uniref:hypothetical protein n=1 Tax=Candidatus Nanopusillus massiliensis TaxID=2897163 RepID=UPI001E32392D|nr:hypothetical protein [Candidatus Nanopusillus massiliensis]